MVPTRMISTEVNEDNEGLGVELAKGSGPRDNPFVRFCKKLCFCDLL
jgi:hypothetical protein